jgi:hypothetical protein
VIGRIQLKKFFCATRGRTGLIARPHIYRVALQRLLMTPHHRFDFFTASKAGKEIAYTEIGAPKRRHRSFGPQFIRLVNMS